MGTIIILEETTKNPITLIGKRAGICWNSDIKDGKKNYKRGIDCILSQHGRTLEFVNVEMIIDGYSARVIREWYTHIAGGPTRLQSSTRYVKWDGEFEDNFVMASKIKEAVESNQDVKAAYSDFVKSFQTLMNRLDGIGAPKEDIALFYPLGMTTKIVDKRNLRSLVVMSRQRMCTRAYHEYRRLFNDIIKALSNYSEEWKWICNNLFYPKCEELGYCPEKNGCGRK